MTSELNNKIHSNTFNNSVHYNPSSQKFQLTYIVTEQLNPRILVAYDDFRRKLKVVQRGSERKKSNSTWIHFGRFNSTSNMHDMHCT